MLLPVSLSETVIGQYSYESAVRDYFDVSSESLAHTVQAECQRIARLVDSDTAIKALEDWNLSGEVDDDLLLRLIVDE